MYQTRGKMIVAPLKMRKSKTMTKDPMERQMVELLNQAGIRFLCDDHRSGLDFYLPDLDVYIEVKQFHSPRIANQMARRDNVIAVQGKKSFELFKAFLAK
jgi:hypothetical protein